VAKAGAWVQDALPLGEEPFIKPWMMDLADDHLELDITRARTRLGWEPERSLRRTLPRMVAALEADPAGWYRENKLEVPSWLAEGVEARATGVGRRGRGSLSWCTIESCMSNGPCRMTNLGEIPGHWSFAMSHWSCRIQ
jgi:hypothetical protein